MWEIEGKRVGKIKDLYPFFVLSFMPLFFLCSAFPRFNLLSFFHISE